MSRSRTLWEEGHESGGRVVALASGLLAVAVALDLGLGGGISLLFDLTFVAVSLGSALLVRPRDFFVVGVLPPLLMLAVVLVLVLTHRGAVAQPDDGAVQAVVSGLSHHALALGVGYALCLGVLGLRDRFARGLIEPGGLTRAQVRSAPGLRRLRAALPARPPTSRRRSSARQESPRPR